MHAQSIIMVPRILQTDLTEGKKSCQKISTGVIFNVLLQLLVISYGREEDITR